MEKKQLLDSWFDTSNFQRNLLNMVLYIAKPHTCMTDGYRSVIPKKLDDQSKQTWLVNVTTVYTLKGCKFYYNVIPAKTKRWYHDSASN